VDDDDAMAEIVCSVDVAAPADDVWVAMTDWRRQGEWMLGTTVRPIAGDGRGVGGRIEAVTGLGGPLGIRDTMEITHWEPPRRCLVRHTGRVIRGAGAFEVEPIGDRRSRFVWSEWLDLPLGRAGQVGFLLTRPLFVAGVRLSLRRFAAWVVAREAAARAATNR
jgi:hypothetical protein